MKRVAMVLIFAILYSGTSYAYNKSEDLQTGTQSGVSIGTVDSFEAIQYQFIDGALTIVKSKKTYIDAADANRFCDDLGNEFKPLSSQVASALANYSNIVNGPIRYQKVLSFLEGMVTSLDLIYPEVYTWSPDQLRVYFTSNDQHRGMDLTKVTMDQIDQQIIKVESTSINQISAKNLCFNDSNEYYLSDSTCKENTKACPHFQPYTEGVGGYLYNENNGGTCNYMVSKEEDAKIKAELFERYVSAIVSSKETELRNELEWLKILKTVKQNGQFSFCEKFDQN